MNIEEPDIEKAILTAGDKLFHVQVADNYRGTPGNLGAQVLRRDEGDIAHFLTLSYWEGEDAIRAFAGNDLLKARYYPEDEAFLLEIEPQVVHYEVRSAG